MTLASTMRCIVIWDPDRNDQNGVAEMVDTLRIAWERFRMFERRALRFVMSSHPEVLEMAHQWLMDTRGVDFPSNDKAVWIVAIEDPVWVNDLPALYSAVRAMQAGMHSRMKPEQTESLMIKGLDSEIPL